MAEKPDLNKKNLRHAIIGIVINQEGIPLDEIFFDSNKEKCEKAIRIANEVIELIEKVNIKG